MLDLIIFEVEKRSLSVLAAEVIEIVRVVAVTELAGCEAPFVGVINYRGTVVPVARLNPDTSPRPSDHMLIMGQDSYASMCLVVDRVLAFTTADEVLALTDVNKGGFQSLKLTPELARVGNTLVPLLKLEVLLAQTPDLPLSLPMQETPASAFNAS